MKKVLIFIPYFKSGGAERFIINFLNNFDKGKYTFELVCINSENSIYDKQLSELHINKNILIKKNCDYFIKYIKSYIAFYKFLKKQSVKFDIIHFNIAHGEDLPFIAIAKKFKIKVRILHSHNSSVNSFIKYLGHKICKLFFQNTATYYCACSELAARWLMPKKIFKKKKYAIIMNGIKTEDYIFNKRNRIDKRRELNIVNKVALINIGRLNKQKNQKFLLDTFTNINKELPDSVLFIVGEGELRHDLEKYARLLGIRENVRFLGNRTDIPELLSAGDAFVLPSLYEGFPFTIVEAQTSGISCVISDRISEECVMTDLVKRVPLDINIFSEAIISAINNNNNNREKYKQIICDKGYDIKEITKKLEKIYRG